MGKVAFYGEVVWSYEIKVIVYGEAVADSKKR